MITSGNVFDLTLLVVILILTSRFCSIQHPEAPEAKGVYSVGCVRGNRRSLRRDGSNAICRSGTMVEHEEHKWHAELRGP